MSDKSKKLMDQLEEEGIENVHRTLAIHHQVLMDLVGGGKSKVEVPKRAKREEPKKSVFDPATMRRSPPSAGEPMPPGAKDSRVAIDDRLESAANTVGGDPAEKIAEEKEKIAADVAQAKKSGTEIGADHPDDKGEDDVRFADEEAGDTDNDAPTIRKRSAKKVKKAR